MGMETSIAVELRTAEPHRQIFRQQQVLLNDLKDRVCLRNNGSVFSIIQSYRDFVTIYAVSDWAKMMWEMAQLLYAINPSLLYKEARSKKNVWFQTSPAKHYQELAAGLFFCPSHSSTWNKMAILKNLFKIYQIDEDELAFGLAPIKDIDEQKQL